MFLALWIVMALICVWGKAYLTALLFVLIGILTEFLRQWEKGNISFLKPKAKEDSETARKTQQAQPEPDADAWRAEVHRQAEARAAGDKELLEEQRRRAEEQKRLAEEKRLTERKARQAKPGPDADAWRAEVHRQAEARAAGDKQLRVANAGPEQIPVKKPAAQPGAQPSAAVKKAQTPQTETAASGTCGSNLTWSFADGVLTIDGNGPMDDYEYDHGTSCSPWNKFTPLIHTVLIQDGVTRIGNYAFRRANHLTRVSIPGSVCGLGEGSFEYCTGLKSIEIPENVSIIGGKAFWQDNGLTEAKLPSSITEIGCDAFGNCFHLKDVYYSGTGKQWSRIRKGSCKELNSAVIHYNEAAEAAERLAEQKRLAKEKRLAEEVAARQAEEQRKRKAAEHAAFISQLKEQTDALPPSGRDIATQAGQRQLFDDLAVLIPKLAECKVPPHRAARLYAEKIDNLDELLSAVSGVMSGTGRILAGTGLETVAENWAKLSDEELLRGYKALRCYEELSEFGGNFKAAADLLAELLQERFAEQRAAVVALIAELLQERLDEQRTAVNARLIPAWRENENAGLVSTLLDSDPVGLQKRIREAGAEDVMIFLQELESEMAAASPEDREILKAVYDFADGVQKHP